MKSPKKDNGIALLPEEVEAVLEVQQAAFLQSHDEKALIRRVDRR